jgi:hypothetical protein
MAGVHITYNQMLAWMQSIFADYNEAITVRQLYYQYVSRQFLPNSSGTYKKVSRDCTTARELGHVPADAIEDRNREAVGGDQEYDDSSEKFIEDAISNVKNRWMLYSYPSWVNQPKYIEVWVEKAALQSIVQDVCRGYRVRSCAAKGFSSFTFAHDAAERFAEQSDKECKILYFGDFDPSGECMVSDLIERINRYGAEDVVIEKVSLTKKQVVDWKLPYDFAKVGDSRSKKFIEVNGDMCVELDAVPPDALRELIKDAILKNIDVDIWQKNREFHEEERAKIRKWCQGLTVSSEPEYAPQTRYEL